MIVLSTRLWFNSFWNSYYSGVDVKYELCSYLRQIIGIFVCCAMLTWSCCWLFKCVFLIHSNALTLEHTRRPKGLAGPRPDAERGDEQAAEEHQPRHLHAQNHGHYFIHWWVKGAVWYLLHAAATAGLLLYVCIYTQCLLQTCVLVVLSYTHGDVSLELFHFST